MGDVKFGCPSCGQHFVIDARVTGYWVTCTECDTAFQVPKPAPFLRPMPPPTRLPPRHTPTLPPPRHTPLQRRTPVERISLGARIRAWLPKWRFEIRLPQWQIQPLGLLSLLVLTPLCGIALWLHPRTGMADPIESHSPHKLIAKTESDLREGRVSEAADTMRTLLAAFPRSDEAHTLGCLIRIVRKTEPGRNKDFSAPCSESDALLIRRQIEIKESLLATYSNLPPERRVQYARLFGSRTFDQPDLSLDGILCTLRQVESFRAKETERFDSR